MSAAHVADFSAGGFVLVARLERPENNLQRSNLKKQGRSETGGHHSNGSENFHYGLSPGCGKIVRSRAQFQPHRRWTNRQVDPESLRGSFYRPIAREPGPTLPRWFRIPRLAGDVIITAGKSFSTRTGGFNSFAITKGPSIPPTAQSHSSGLSAAGRCCFSINPCARNPPADKIGNAQFVIGRRLR
jgi:hypothetical protein